MRVADMRVPTYGYPHVASEASCLAHRSSNSVPVANATVCRRGVTGSAAARLSGHGESERIWRAQPENVATRSTTDVALTNGKVNTRRPLLRCKKKDCCVGRGVARSGVGRGEQIVINAGEITTIACRPVLGRQTLHVVVRVETAWRVRRRRAHALDPSRKDARKPRVNGLTEQLEEG